MKCQNLVSCENKESISICCLVTAQCVISVYILKVQTVKTLNHLPCFYLFREGCKWVQLNCIFCESCYLFLCIGNVLYICPIVLHCLYF